MLYKIECSQTLSVSLSLYENDIKNGDETHISLIKILFMGVRHINMLLSQLFNQIILHCNIIKTIR